MRLHKFLAAAGVCSRRTAEKWIVSGRVTVDGAPVTQLGVKIDPDSAEVRVDGRLVLLPARHIHLMLHKPKDCLTTRFDPQGRRTVMDILPPAYQRLHPVGRLDRNTTGLLLMTDDGEWTQLLLHPRHRVAKVYRATVNGRLTKSAVKRLLSGVETVVGSCQADAVEVVSAAGNETVLRVTVHQGRKRQVRRMLTAVGHPVKDLHRESIGPIALGDLPPGEYRLLTDDEVEELRAAASPP